MSALQLLAQADALGRAVALLLLLMSVGSWVVLLWKFWLLRRAAADLALAVPDSRQRRRRDLRFLEIVVAGDGNVDARHEAGTRDAVHQADGDEVVPAADGSRLSRHITVVRPELAGKQQTQP